MGSKRLTAKKVAKIDSKNDMAKVQNLRLRGRTFYYHRDIPKTLRELFQGKSQIWISLKTNDSAKAKQLCLELTLEHDKQIEAYRQRNQQENFDFPEEYLDALAASWSVGWLKEDERGRIKGTVRPSEVQLLGLSHHPVTLRSILTREGKEGWNQNKVKHSVEKKSNLHIWSLLSLIC